MKRLTYYRVLLVVWCNAVFSVQAQDIHYMVIEKQARPLQIEDYNQNHRGIITDIVKKVLANNHKLKIHTKPFNAMVQELEGGRYQNWLWYGTPAWKGIQSANLSKIPLLTVSHQLVTAKEHQLDFNQLEDLYGKTAILLSGFDYPGLEEHLGPNKIKALWVKNYKLAFKMLNRLKKIAFFVEMDLRINYNLKKLNLSTASFNRQSFAQVIPDFTLFLAYSPNIDPSLYTEIESGVEQLKKSGTLAQIINQYQ